MTREDFIQKLQGAVLSDRRKNYGPPEDNFARIASLWNTYSTLTGRAGNCTPADVAIHMILMKIARLVETIDHQDSWLDIAGYAVCGSEITTDGEVNGSALK